MRTLKFEAELEIAEVRRLGEYLVAGAENDTQPDDLRENGMADIASACEDGIDRIDRIGRILIQQANAAENETPRATIGGGEPCVYPEDLE